MYNIMYGHILFFFFSSRRRHTRLQGDWSSDVCSSDLLPRAPGAGMVGRGPQQPHPQLLGGEERPRVPHGPGGRAQLLRRGRSGERRGGEECRSRWGPDHLKKKKKKKYREYIYRIIYRW